MVERFNFCTHHHADPIDAQAGLCPYHDAIAYCQYCGVFIFNPKGLKKHDWHADPKKNHYLQYFDGLEGKE